MQLTGFKIQALHCWAGGRRKAIMGHGGLGVSSFPSSEIYIGAPPFSPLAQTGRVQAARGGRWGERPPVRDGRWRERPLARSPAIGVVVEAAEVRVSSFRDSNSHRP
jgi:hypothetical protein